MADMNSVNLIGRLTKDCSLKTLPSGTQLVEFSIANNTGWGDNARTTFVDVKLWGKGAAGVAKYLVKGKRVGVSGALQLDSWVDRDSGQKRSKLYINTFEVCLLDGGESNNGNSSFGEKDKWAGKDDAANVEPEDAEDIPF
jgi:single-strand DNA-binding protein